MGYSYRLGRNTTGNLIAGEDADRIAILWSDVGLGTCNIALGAGSSGVVVNPQSAYGSIKQPLYCEYQSLIQRQIVRGPIGAPPGYAFIDIRDDLCKPPYNSGWKFGGLASRTVEIKGIIGTVWQQALPANQERVSIIICNQSLGGTSQFYSPQPSVSTPGLCGITLDMDIYLLFRYCDLGNIVRDSVWYANIAGPHPLPTSITEVYKVPCD